jgi:ribosome-binding factor A
MSPKIIKPPTLRQQKANSLFQQRLAEIILNNDYPGIFGVVTITRVECMADMRDAKVWISSVGQEVEEVLKILERNIYEIQGELYRGSTMRIVPKIKFYIDRDIEYASHIDQVLRNLKHE